MSWEIVLGIIALVGFFITVGTPILKLNTNIIRLNESVNNLQGAIDKNESNSKEARKRIWNHMDGVDSTIKDHEDRLTRAEASLSMQNEKLTRIEADTINQEHRIIVMESGASQHNK